MKTNALMWRAGFCVLPLVLASSARADDLTVTIGQSVPMTGSQANKGKSAQNGALLAIEDLNKAGVMVGGKKVTFQLNTQDDQADPRTGVTVAQKIIDGGAVAVIGPYNSGVALPAEVPYAAAGIPVLTIATNPAVTAQGKPDVFRIDANDGQLGSNMALYAVDKLHARTAAVIDDRTAYGEGIAAEFKRAATAKGVRIVDQEYTNSQAVDFNAILTLIKSHKPDVIFYGGDAGQAAPLVKQMHKLAIDAKLLGGDGICTPYLGEVAGSDAASVICSRGTVDLQKTAQGADFSSRYAKRFNVPPQDYAVNFYDAVMLIGNAVKVAGSTQPQALVAALKAHSYQGVAATYAWDEHGNLQNAPSTIYTFRDGKMVPLE